VHSETNAVVGYLHDEPAGANFIPSFASASPECNKGKGRQAKSLAVKNLVRRNTVKSVQFFGDLLNVVPSQQGNAGNRLVVAEHRYDTHSSVTHVRVHSGVEYRRKG
jgi:hypothetical protein